MTRYKLENLEYESVTASEVIERLKLIPEIEIIGIQRGLSQNGYHAPGLLYSGGGLRSTNYHGGSELGGGNNNYIEEHGTVIRVKRGRVSLGKRALQMVNCAELEPSQQIGDLVQFLHDRIGIKTVDYLTCLEKDHGGYNFSRVTYLEKIGESTMEKRLDLYTDEYSGPEYAYSNAKDNSRLFGKAETVVKHIVKPTFVMPADF